MKFQKPVYYKECDSFKNKNQQSLNRNQIIQKKVVSCEKNVEKQGSQIIHLSLTFSGIIILLLFYIFLIQNNNHDISVNLNSDNKTYHEQEIQQEYYEEKFSIEQFYKKSLNLKLSEFQAKCSHNSFRQQDYYKQLKFDYKNIYHGGCQMLEFDLALKEINEDQVQEKYNIYIAHDKQEDPAFTLKNELKIVYDFHKENKEHLPIFVTLNLKSWILNFDLESDQFYQNLENQIQQVFQKDEDIYYPGQMLKGEENLYKAIQKYGQIKIGDIIGKVVFILDAALYNMKNQKFTQFYQNYHNDIKDRLMFATLDSRLIQNNFYRSIQNYIQETNSYNQIFINIQTNYKYNGNQYQTGLRVLQEAKKMNFVTRGYTFNDLQKYQRFKSLGMNFLCTDKLFENSFIQPL